MTRAAFTASPHRMRSLTSRVRNRHRTCFSMRGQWRMRHQYVGVEGHRLRASARSSIHFSAPSSSGSPCRYLLKTPKAAKSLGSCDSSRMFPACSRFYPRCRLLLAGRLCSRADRPEVVALRHQLNVLRRQRPGRPWLSCADRLLRVWLYWNLLWPRCLLAEQRLRLVCGSDRNSPRFVAPRRYWFLPLLKFGSDGIFSKDSS
jgi:hypothetical protein